MFRNRVDAGRQLAGKLLRYENRKDVLVLGIPRGGVPVAFQVAQALHAPMDITLVRKLGVPSQPELAMGAIASGGARIFNRRVIAEIGVSREQILETIASEEAELRRRERFYRGIRPEISVAGKTVILVDDGIATGSSMLAAIAALRTLHPKRIIAAVPVAPSHADVDIGTAADEFVCVDQPEGFSGVGQFYEDFSQVEDGDVRELLEDSAYLTSTVPAMAKSGAK